MQMEWQTVFAQTCLSENLGSLRYWVNLMSESFANFLKIFHGMFAGAEAIIRIKY